LCPIAADPPKLANCRSVSSSAFDNIISAVTGAVEKWIHKPEGRDDLTLLLLRKL
jgi:hypothetical protein